MMSNKNSHNSPGDPLRTSNDQKRKKAQKPGGLALLLAFKKNLRRWAEHLLLRTAMLFGAEYVKEALARKQPCFTMFSGIECCRAAWSFIEKAAYDLWGVKTGLHFKFAATRLRL